MLSRVIAKNIGDVFLETQCIDETFNRLCRVHERYRQTDDRRTDDDTANMNMSLRSLKMKFYYDETLLKGE